jgi:hypothetical protein
MIDELREVLHFAGLQVGVSFSISADVLYKSMRNALEALDMRMQ